MLHIKRLVILLGALGLGTTLVVAALLVGLGVTGPIWVSAASAVVSFLALMISFLSFFIAEERSRFSNAFAIARKWDEPPMLQAREVLVPHLEHVADLPTILKAEYSVNRALVHYVNFYWDMAAAIETRWTDSRYLRLRFRQTLDTYYPAMRALLEASPDRGAPDALRSIEWLRREWRLPV